MTYNCDLFICHASEDKSAVARPLAEALSFLGLRVWFDAGLRVLRGGNPTSNHFDQIPRVTESVQAVLRLATDGAADEADR